MADDFDIDTLDDNFEDFDGLDMDGDFAETKDDRKPIVKAATGFLEGAKDAALSSNVRREMIKKALPQGYSDVHDDLEETYDFGTRLYDDAKAKAEESKGPLKRIAGHLAKSLDGKISPKMVEKLKSFSVDHDNYGGTLNEVDYDALEQETGVKEVFGDFFEAQAQDDAEEHAADTELNLIHEAKEDIRHGTSISVLEKILEAERRKISFGETIQARYYRQSMILQYRQWWAQRDLLTLHEGFSKESKTLLEAIVKNTGLPDYRKNQLLEVAGQQTREAIISSAIGATKEAIGSGIKNKLREKVLGTVTKLKDGLLSGAGLLDMQAEMGGGDEDSITGYGNMVGSMATGWVSEYLADKNAHDSENRKRVDVDPNAPWYKRMMAKVNNKAVDFNDAVGDKVASKEDIARYGEAAQYLSSNKFDLLQRELDARLASVEKRSADRDTDVDPDATFFQKIMGYGKNAGNSLRDSAEMKALLHLSDLMPGSQQFQFGMDNSSDTLADDHHYWSRLSDRTLNEIIPEHLTGIRAELEMMRTGADSVDNMRYDHDSHTLVRESVLNNKIMEKVAPVREAEALRDTIRDVIASLDEEKVLSEGARDSLERQMIKDVHEKHGLNPIRLAKESTLTQVLDPDEKKEIADFFKARFINDEGGLDMDSTKLQKLNQVDKVYKKAKNYVPDYAAQMEKVAKTYGRGGLARTGLVRLNESSGLTIREEEEAAEKEKLKVKAMTEAERALYNHRKSRAGGMVGSYSGDTDLIFDRLKNMEASRVKEETTPTDDTPEPGTLPYTDFPELRRKERLALGASAADAGTLERLGVIEDLLRNIDTEARDTHVTLAQTTNDWLRRIYERMGGMPPSPTPPIPPNGPPAGPDGGGPKRTNPFVARTGPWGPTGSRSTTRSEAANDVFMADRVDPANDPYIEDYVEEYKATGTDGYVLQDANSNDLEPRGRLARLKDKVTSIGDSFNAPTLSSGDGTETPGSDVSAPGVIGGQSIGDRLSSGVSELRSLVSDKVSKILPKEDASVPDAPDAEDTSNPSYAKLKNKVVSFIGRGNESAELDDADAVDSIDGVEPTILSTDEIKAKADRIFNKYIKPKKTASDTQPESDDESLEEVDASLALKERVEETKKQAQSIVSKLIAAAKAAPESDDIEDPEALESAGEPLTVRDRLAQAKKQALSKLAELTADKPDEEVSVDPEALEAADAPITIRDRFAQAKKQTLSKLAKLTADKTDEEVSVDPEALEAAAAPLAVRDRFAQTTKRAQAALSRLTAGKPDEEVSVDPEALESTDAPITIRDSFAQTTKRAQAALSRLTAGKPDALDADEVADDNVIEQSNKDKVTAKLTETKDNVLSLVDAAAKRLKRPNANTLAVVADDSIDNEDELAGVEDVSATGRAREFLERKSVDVIDEVKAIKQSLLTLTGKRNESDAAVPEDDIDATDAVGEKVSAKDRIVSMSDKLVGGLRERFMPADAAPMDLGAMTYTPFEGEAEFVRGGVHDEKTSVLQDVRSAAAGRVGSLIERVSNKQANDVPDDSDEPADDSASSESLLDKAKKVDVQGLLKQARDKITSKITDVSVDEPDVVEESLSDKVSSGVGALLGAVGVLKSPDALSVPEDESAIPASVAPTTIAEKLHATSKRVKDRVLIEMEKIPDRAHAGVDELTGLKDSVVLQSKKLTGAQKDDVSIPDDSEAEDVLESAPQTDTLSQGIADIKRRALAQTDKLPESLRTGAKELKDRVLAETEKLPGAVTSRVDEIRDFKDKVASRLGIKVEADDGTASPDDHVADPDAVEAGMMASLNKQMANLKGKLNIKDKPEVEADGTAKKPFLERVSDHARGLVDDASENIASLRGSKELVVYEGSGADDVIGDTDALEGVGQNTGDTVVNSITSALNRIQSVVGSNNDNRTGDTVHHAADAPEFGADHYSVIDPEANSNIQWLEHLKAFLNRSHNELLTALAPDEEGGPKGPGKIRKFFSSLFGKSGSKDEDSVPADVYVRGEDKPILLGRNMVRGHYFDEATGDPVLSIKGVKGPVVDKDGNVVLSNDDLWKGIVDTKSRAPKKGMIRKLWDLSTSPYRAMYHGVKGALGIVGSVKDGVADVVQRNLKGLVFGDKAKGDIQDIYLKGVDEPIMRAKDLATGMYLDHETGEPVRTTDDIKGPIVDATGNLVIAQSDIDAERVVTKGGRTLGGLVRSVGLGALKAQLSFAKFVYSAPIKLGKKLLTDPVDIYVEGEKKPALTSRLIKKDHYLDQETGDVIRFVGDIKGPVVDKEGNVVLTEEDIDTGLIDTRGKVYKGAADLAVGAGKLSIGALGVGASIMMAPYKLAWKGLKGAKKLLTKNKDPKIDESAPKSQEEIDAAIIRMKKNDAAWAGTEYIEPEGPGAASPSAGATESVNSAAESMVEALIPSFNEVTGAIDESKMSFSVDMSEVVDHVDATTGVLEKIHDLLDSRLPPPTGRYDIGRDGFRDGGWEEQLANKRNKNSSGGMSGGAMLGMAGAAGASGGGYNGGGGGGSDRDGGGNSLIDGALERTGEYAAEKAGSALKRGTDWIKDKIAARGGIIRAAAAVGGSLIGGLGSLATGAGALLKGGAALLGGVAALKVIAVAGVGYGLYRGAKWLFGTKPPKSDVDKLRYLQYGFSPKSDDAIRVVKAEKKILKNVSYDGDGVPTVDMSDDEVLDAFGVDANDAAASERFGQWYNGRFLPTLVAHATAARLAEPKSELGDVSDFKDLVKAEFVENAIDEEGLTSIVGVTTNPFTEGEYLIGSHRQIVNEKNRILAELKKDGHTAKPKEVDDVGATADADAIGAEQAPPAEKPGMGAGWASESIDPAPKTNASAGGLAAAGLASGRFSAGTTDLTNAVSGSTDIDVIEPPPRDTTTYAGLAAALLGGSAVGRELLDKRSTVTDTPNPDDEFTNLRMTQYGFDVESESARRTYAAEKALERDVVVNSDSPPDVLTSPEDALAAFGINPDDPEAVERFGRWYANRFLPVYKKHIQASVDATGSSSLDDAYVAADDAQKRQFVMDVNEPTYVSQATNHYPHPYKKNWGLLVNTALPPVDTILSRLPASDMDSVEPLYKDYASAAGTDDAPMLAGTVLGKTESLLGGGGMLSGGPLHGVTGPTELEGDMSASSIAGRMMGAMVTASPVGMLAGGALGIKDNIFNKDDDVAETEVKKEISGSRKLRASPAAYIVDRIRDSAIDRAKEAATEKAGDLLKSGMVAASPVAMLAGGASDLKDKIFNRDDDVAESGSEANGSSMMGRIMGGLSAASPVAMLARGAMGLKDKIFGDGESAQQPSAMGAIGKMLGATTVGRVASAIPMGKIAGAAIGLKDRIMDGGMAAMSPATMLANKAMDLKDSLMGGADDPSTEKPSLARRMLNLSPAGMLAGKAMDLKDRIFKRDDVTETDTDVKKPSLARRMMGLSPVGMLAGGALGLKDKIFGSKDNDTDEEADAVDKKPSLARRTMNLSPAGMLAGKAMDLKDRIFSKGEDESDNPSLARRMMNLSPAGMLAGKAMDLKDRIFKRDDVTETDTDVKKPSLAIRMMGLSPVGMLAGGASGLKDKIFGSKDNDTDEEADAVDKKPSLVRRMMGLSPAGMLAGGALGLKDRIFSKGEDESDKPSLARRMMNLSPAGMVAGGAMSLKDRIFKKDDTDSDKPSMARRLMNLSPAGILAGKAMDAKDMLLDTATGLKDSAVSGVKSLSDTVVNGVTDTATGIRDKAVSGLKTAASAGGSAMMGMLKTATNPAAMLYSGASKLKDKLFSKDDTIPPATDDGRPTKSLLNRIVGAGSPLNRGMGMLAAPGMAIGSGIRDGIGRLFTKEPKPKVVKSALPSKALAKEAASGGIGSKVHGVLKSIVSPVGAIGSAIGGGARSMIAGAGSRSMDLLKSVDYDKLGSGIASGAKSVGSGALSLAKGIVSPVGAIGSGIGNGIRSAAVAGLSKAGSGLYNAGSDVVRGGIDAVKNQFSADTLKDRGLSLLNGLKKTGAMVSGVLPGMSDVKDKLLNVGKGVVGNVAGLVPEGVKASGSEAVAKLKSFVGDKLKPMADAEGLMKSALVGLVKAGTPITRLVSGLSSMKDRMLKSSEVMDNADEPAMASGAVMSPTHTLLSEATTDEGVSDRFERDHKDSLSQELGGGDTPAVATVPNEAASSKTGEDVRSTSELMKQDTKASNETSQTDNLIGKYEAKERVGAERKANDMQMNSQRQAKEQLSVMKSISKTLNASLDEQTAMRKGIDEMSRSMERYHQSIAKLVMASGRGDRTSDPRAGTERNATKGPALKALEPGNDPVSMRRH